MYRFRSLSCRLSSAMLGQKSSRFMMLQSLNVQLKTVVLPLNQVIKSLCDVTGIRRLHVGKTLLEKQVIHVPAMGDSISEGTIVKFSKSIGEAVGVDDIVVVLETDKVSVDVRTSHAGTLVEYYAGLEDTVEVGKPLFAVDSSVPPSEKSTETSSNPVAVPENPKDAVITSKDVNAPSSNHVIRSPLIKFLGKRSLHAPHVAHFPATPVIKSPAPAISATPISSANGISLQELPPLFGRLPFSRKEIEAIMTGYSEL